MRNLNLSSIGKGALKLTLSFSTASLLTGCSAAYSGLASLSSEQSSTGRSGMSSLSLQEGTLVTSNDFEGGFNFENWGNAGFVAGAGMYGSKGLRVGTGSGGAGCSTMGALTRGKMYRLKGQARVGSAANPGDFGIKFLNASNQTILDKKNFIQNTSFQLSTVDFTVPQNAQSAYIYVWKNSNADYLYLDNMEIRELIDVPPPPTPTPTPVPTPVPTPTPTPAPPSEQFVLRYNFDSSVSFENWANTTSAPGEGIGGSGAIRTGTSSGGAGINLMSGLTRGKTYRFKAQLRVSDGSVTGTFGVKFIDGNNQVLLDRTNNIQSTSYQLSTIEAVVPATAQVAYMYIWKNSSSGYLYADNFEVYEVTSGGGTSPTPTPTPTPAPTPVPTPTPPPVASFDPALNYAVNISAGNGAENTLPGYLGGEVYVTPESHFAYYASKGFTAIRVQSIWERIQPSLYGPLNGQLQTYGGSTDPMRDMVTHIKYYLDMAQKYNMKAFLDLSHNYGRRWVGYNGNWNSKTQAQLGSAQVPYDAFTDFNVKLVQTFGSHPAVAGIELMNEPHDLSVGSDGWREACQRSITAIRQINSTIPIIIDGYSWASANYWEGNNPTLHTLNDPSNKLIFSAHVYFDNAEAGLYAGAEATNPTHTNYDLGSQRIQSFLRWINAHGLQGHGQIGEFGAPHSPRWAEIERRFIITAKNAGLMLTPHQDIAYPNDPYVMNLYPANGQGDRYTVLLMQSLKLGTNYLYTPLAQ